MSWLRPAQAKAPPPTDTDGRRLIGLTLETRQPIWAPKGHSLLLSANGGGKTTSGAMVWLYSLLSSVSPSAVLVMDSKDGELAIQCAAMIAKLGRPVAVIDDQGVLPPDYPYRVSLNAIDAVTSTYQEAPEDLVFANETVTNALIEEPERDQRNRYWRSWPRLLIEFAIYVLLKRNPQLATPGGLWALLSNPAMMRKFAAIEAEEGDGMLQVHARNVLGMVEHEHWPQHLEAAQDALRIFSIGSRLHTAGAQATVTHYDLIRNRTIIFLVGPQAYINRLGPYYALHIMGFTNALYRRAGPLTFINDEFTNAPLKRFVDALTTLRAYRGEAHNIAQSRSEIERKFGKLETQTIEENAIVKQWFGFSSFDEAERVSKAIGDEQVINPGMSTDNKELRLQFSYQTGKERAFTPNKLMAMPADEQLIHFKGVGFVHALKISQQNIAPYCHQIAANPLEGGKLPADPKITLSLPKGSFH